MTELLSKAHPAQPAEGTAAPNGSPDGHRSQGPQGPAAASSPLPRPGPSLWPVPPEGGSAPAAPSPSAG